MNGLTLGLSTTATGMLVVFSGLVILIACIYLMTAFTHRKKAPSPVPAPAAAPAAPPVTEEVPEEEDDLQIVAVITAAVAAVWQQEGNESGFVVRRVRRVQNSTSRARAAREEQIYSRL